ncbi:sulfotransferase family 2 domain-containing protein [Synechococcus sp. CBW1004]|uniref:sulfotransferase family 2 domain-containing protein n=1 Tax=Synechococcus sp. CBW1004 TaxID=1353136 RepID=UPI0018CEE843|nr:sulfotransferase family 2 domain-containing protein [Synechococcus sp. CBW1004]QPN63429.1 sulfotransferase family 2 domain-containing protein [Synechococcus sp. CBW1004]
MLISHQSKFIFVHVQKTAGISFESVLTRNFPDLMRWHGRHGFAREGAVELGVERWSDFYSFGFVRNPWERLVSWYAMIDAARLKLPLWKRWRTAPFQYKNWNEVYRKAKNFEQFVEKCTDVTWDNGCLKSFAFNQIDYLSDADGRILVDKIGRFENIAADSAEIFSRLQIDDRLPHRNRSTHRHYSEWYSDRVRDVVAERFSRDIEAFGYRFERV